MGRILVVDDDILFSEPFAFYIGEIGHECEIATTFREGLASAARQDFDLIFLDVFLPDASGLEGISRFKQLASAPEVVIITGQGTRHGAEIALKNGAWDYLPKPPDYSQVKLTVIRAMQYRRMKRQYYQKRDLNRDAIIGRDPKLNACLEIVARAAETDGAVLISGETGTGKELFAEAIHINSQRAAHPFTRVDCTNLPEHLVDSLLLGHEKGAYTGADTRQEGLIRQAHRGTLFLDEIGDLHPSGQKSLLTVLNSRKFRPIGAKTEQTSDFRLISATNRDLLHMVKTGAFRKDLYFRLFSFHIHLPPLRERIEDIEALIAHLLEKVCAELGVGLKSASEDYVAFLSGYDWPGNIRELVNVLRASIANAGQEPVIHPHHLPMHLRVCYSQQNFDANPPGAECPASLPLMLDDNRFPSLKEFRTASEAVYLDSLLRLADGNAAKACDLAGVSRSGLYLLLDKHGKKLKAEQG